MKTPRPRWYPWLAALCLGCPARHPQTAPAEPTAQVAPGVPVSGAMWLQGFSIVWQARPHRISRIRLGAIGSFDGTQDGGTGELYTEVRGGTWASGKLAYDSPEVSVLYAGVAAPDLVVVPGQAELVLRGGIGPKDAEQKQPNGNIEAVLELPEGAPDIGVVWLTGIDVATAPSHPNGYTPNSLAVQLGAPEIRDGTARINVHARVEAAPTPDRRQRLKSYGATVRVRFVLVLAEGATAQQHVVETELDNGLEPIEGLRKVPSERLPFALQIGTTHSAVIGGLSGFSVDVRQRGPVSGRYMRAFTVALEDERHDPLTGTYSAQAALRFTNAGALPRPTRVDAKAMVSVLALEQDARVIRGRWDAGGEPACVAYPSFESRECPAKPLSWDEDPR